MDSNKNEIRSDIYQQFIADYKLFRDEMQIKRFEAYARGQKVDLNVASYQELKTLLSKFIVYQLYG